MKEEPFLTIELLRRIFSDEYLIVKNKPAIIRKKEFYDIREVATLISADWKAYDLLYFMRKARIIRYNGLPYKHYNKHGVMGGRKLGVNDYDIIFTEAGVAYVRDCYFNGPMAGIIKLGGCFS